MRLEPEKKDTRLDQTRGQAQYLPMWLLATFDLDKKNLARSGLVMENVSTVDRSRAIQGPVRFIRGGIPHETQ